MTQEHVAVVAIRVSTAAPPSVLVVPEYCVVDTVAVAVVMKKKMSRSNDDNNNTIDARMMNAVVLRRVPTVAPLRPTVAWPPALVVRDFYGVGFGAVVVIKTKKTLR